MKQDAPLQFFETTDPGLLAEYFALRHRVFLNEYPWLKDDFSVEDETDRVSRFVVAVRDGAVRGGARFTISTAARPQALPLEKGTGPLAASPLVQGFNFSRSAYAEISRMAIEPGSSKGARVSIGLSREIWSAAVRNGVDTIFCICPDRPADLNERNAKLGGIPFRRHGRVPTPYGPEMWLCSFASLLTVFHAEPEAA